MRMLFLRFAYAFPLLVMLATDSTAYAQRSAAYGYSGFGVGVGVGYGAGFGPFNGPGWGGPGWGPYYGPGWGYPGWGGALWPNYYNGTWGNGLSLYGPPVPTYKPIPGVFGGGDSRFFGLPPMYPGYQFMYFSKAPLARPSPLPPGVIDGPQENLNAPQELLPPPKAAGPVELEVRVPTEATLVYIDGTVTKSTGLVRRFNSPPFESTESHTYELRAEWKVDGLTQTHTRRVSVKPGDKVVVELGK